MNIPIHYCSAEGRMGLDDLVADLAGQTAAFVGHSGVGKSSIVAALRPDLEIEVGDVSSGNSKGAHTTRRSTLYEIGENTRLIDTPGIRSFGLWQLTAEELVFSFPEFDQFQCRFRDCSHVHEPGCGILGAIEAGDLSRDRYETFIRLRESLG